MIGCRSGGLVVAYHDDANVINDEVGRVSMAGRMVREARGRAGLTQRQLAARSGIPQETIARIERGRADPRVMTLDRLLAACDFGIEVMPRLGIGIDRTQIAERLSVPMERRLDVAMADDSHFVEWGRSIRRIAE
jgi:transcriptional regulator with XRE-family HTH domain